MNPIRAACLKEAANIWRDQPSLGMLETANEVRVNIRGQRDSGFKKLPGSEIISKWLVEAIELGELKGPIDDPRFHKPSKARLAQR
jgi:hypothetical protein